jgi:hypothetical protein
MAWQGNWVDLVILAFLVIYLGDNWRKGIFVVLAEMAAFVVAAVAGVKLYRYPAQFLEANFQIQVPLGRLIAFLGIMLIVEQMVGRWLLRLVGRIPRKYFPPWWQGALTLLPAGVSGLVIAGVILATVIGLPVRASVKRDLRQSEIGGFLLKQAGLWERKLTGIWGGEVWDGLTFMTVKPEAKTSIGLPVQQQPGGIDEVGEAEMFKLVNQERVRAGRSPLAWRAQVVGVARAHGQDMLRRGYFGHYSPEGKDVGDRLNDAGVGFVVAGENLALAPTVRLAHDGLMGSEGHRRNILGEEFGQVGIGVIDGGIYGKMVVQIFTD